MKKLQLFIIAALVAGFSSMSVAQNATATATANGLLIAGINLVWNQNLAFGNLTTPTTAATAVIGVSGVNIVNSSYFPETPVTTNTNPIAPGVVEFAGDPFPGPATFTVTGQPLYTFAITSPTGGLSIPVAIKNINPGPNSNQMTVDNLTVCVGGNAGVPGLTGALNGAGTQYFAVGGTLHIPAGQASGSYQNGSGTFLVTVAYN